MGGIGLRIFLLALASILTVSPSVTAQPNAETTAVDAIRCWRRVSRHAVTVGERFAMTVTCSVVETDDARTLPEQAALEPATIDVAPFEVLDGEQYEDIRTGPYRFFQYHYTLRIIAENSFGDDVEIPTLELTYRIERRIAENPALVGRELTYVLPAEPIRVLSLVPASIVDIRDLPPPTFGATQSRAFRANLLTLGAALFGLLAIGVAALGVLRVARTRGTSARRVDRRLPRPRIADCALGELTRVQRATAARGWTAESTGHVLAALRVAAAVALSEPVAQAPTDAGTPARDGQLRVRHGWLRPKVAVISSGLTAAAVTKRAEDGLARPRRVADRRTVEDFGRAMTTFTTARYGDRDQLVDEALTRELGTAVARTRRLRWRSAAAVRQATQLVETVRDWWAPWWAR